MTTISLGNPEGLQIDAYGNPSGENARRTVFFRRHLTLERHSLTKQQSKRCYKIWGVDLSAALSLAVGVQIFGRLTEEMLSN